MIRILHGHVLDRLKELPDESVHCCITSPPYWRVRSFDLPPQVWAGNPECNHAFTFSKNTTETYTLAYRPEDRVNELHGICIKCGAFYGSLSSEPTPELYVQNLILVFQAVRRVLRSDGSLWLNLGDRRATQDKNNKLLKPKDLIGLPWLTAFALRASGWYLRSAIILEKTAPIPEAGVDRPMTSYDHLFFLTKEPKYFYDGCAIGDDDINLNVKDVWRIGHEYSSSLHHFGTFPRELPKRCILLGTSNKGVCRLCGSPYVRVFTTTKVQTHNSHTRLPKTKTVPTKEWMPSCKCNVGEPTASVVLDPFGGTGTTSLVAELLNRNSISIELNPVYIKTMKSRLSRDGGLLVSVVEE